MSKFQGLLDITETEEGTAADPDIPEAAKEEPEATVRAAAHDRHPVAAVSIAPETILFIEGSIPLIFRQLVAHLFENEGRALCAGVDSLLNYQERHAFLRGSRAGGDLLERANAELFARPQYPSRIREVLVGDLVVVVIELFTVLLTERLKPLVIHVIIGHRDDAEVHEQSELFGGFGLTVHDQLPFQEIPIINT